MVEDVLSWVEDRRAASREGFPKTSGSLCRFSRKAVLPDHAWPGWQWITRNLLTPEHPMESSRAFAGFGMKADDRVAIDMPMTVESVAIYLGAVAAGCPVVTVADSFAPAEIAVRLGLGQARCIFTQDFAIRLGKRLPL